MNKLSKYINTKNKINSMVNEAIKARLKIKGVECVRIENDNREIDVTYNIDDETFHENYKERNDVKALEKALIDFFNSNETEKRKAEKIAMEITNIYDKTKDCTQEELSHYVVQQYYRYELDKVLSLPEFFNMVADIIG